MHDEMVLVPAPATETALVPAPGTETTIAPAPSVVCPGCTPQDSGGETSDFGSGLSDGCFTEQQPLTDELAAAFDVAEIIARAAQPLIVPIAWKPSFADPRGAPRVYPEPSASEAKLSVGLGDPVFSHRAYKTGETPPYECPDNVTFPATVHFVAADGSIEATLPGTLTRSEFEPVWTLSTHADLATVGGSLDLQIDRARPHRGTLLVTNYGFASGVRGYADLSWEYLDGIKEVLQLRSTWPNDECSIYREPIALDQADGRLAGATVRDLEAEIHELVQAELPLAVRWRSGADDTLDLQWRLDEGALGCISGAGLSTNVDIPVIGTFATASGRLNAPIAWLNAGISNPNVPEERWPFLGIAPEIGAVTPATLEASGVHGVDLDGASYISASGSAQFSWATGELDEGRMLVEGTRECAEPECAYVNVYECLYWPVEAGLPPICQ
jgi:hypothetical protein